MARPELRSSTGFTPTVLLVLLAAATVPLPAFCGYTPPEISPTVYVGGIQDLHLDATGASKCSRLVDQAASYRSFSRAQFLVSQLWWDSGPRDPPSGWPGCANYTLSTYYCFSRFNDTEVLWWSYGTDPVTEIATPVTGDQIAEFTDLLGRCLEHAIDLGLDVAINVHADDGRAQNGWRNTLAFDPLEPYGGLSFYDIMLAPIADALNRVMHNDSQAWLSLQGEMGATVFFYPWQWEQIAAMVRDRIALGRPELAGRVKLGLGINNSKLAGCCLIDVVDYDVYLPAFAQLWPSIEGWFDLAGIRAAFDAVDFVGISAYVPQKRLDFEPCDMEALMQKMDIEFAFYNLTLRELVFEMGKEIHWIEWGVGGGASQNGDAPAPDALTAAYYPFWGIYGPYNRSRDPWLNPPVRDYMRYYVNQTSQYLLQGGCEYQVEGVYLWSTGSSWDIIGLSNPVYGDTGSFRDEEAVAAIQQHNALAQELATIAEAAALQGQTAAEAAPLETQPGPAVSPAGGFVDLLPPPAAAATDGAVSSMPGSIQAG